VFGWIGAGHQVGAALTAFAAGWIRTSLGDYGLAFSGSGGLRLMAAVPALQVGRRRSSWGKGGYAAPLPAAAAPMAGRE
jgi:hypothetical protein